MLKISVILATFNRAESLKDTLDSLLQQEKGEDFDFEVIIVDNNSTDKTKELAASYVQKFSGKLEYLFESRQGKSFALNTGIKHSRGDILAFTDDDNILSNDWLKEIANVFIKEKDILFACGQIKPFSEDGIKIPHWCSERVFNRVFGCISYGEKAKYLTVNEGVPSGMNSFVRREVFDKIGYFDTTFPRGQDTDFNFRARDKGINFYYSANIVNFHKITKSRLNKKYFRYYHFTAGNNSAQRVSNDKLKETIGKASKIPLWAIKDTVAEALKSILWQLAINSRKSFEHETNLYLLLGRISGAKKYAKS